MTMACCSCYSKAVFANCPRLSIVLSCMFVLVMGIAPRPLHSQTYTDLHDFNCATDGCSAIYAAGILAQGRDGNLYGTLPSGGTSNHGTVFKFTPTGAIATLYNFAGTDGSAPASGLTLGSDGNFYGTASSGGANGFGTIFKITPAGVLTTLHSFTGADGKFPYAPPVQGTNGSYYGVTYSGTAYSITSSGTFNLLTSSIPGRSFAPLFLAKGGGFYGTTPEGGTFNAGTVFQMSKAGTVKIVYSFDVTNGSSPYGPVVQANNGLLFGTTVSGGNFGGGVAFKLSTSGAIREHWFDSSSTTDGYGPVPGLVAATDGNYYGATTSGNQNGSAPDGTLFKIDAFGAYYPPLHTFDLTHGATQYATSMQHTNGILYGLTSAGGVANVGVFYSLDIGLPPFVSLMTTSGTAGNRIEILGDGLTGTTGVMFGSGLASSFTVVSGTYMTAVVPRVRLAM
jgi:uncharacterized repeat protein (TIGR03803 family)